MTQGLRFMVGRHHDGTPLRLGEPINIANVEDREWMHNRYLFSFGCVGTAFVLVYADSVEDGLETAAEFCAEQGWDGLVSPEPCDCPDPFECGCNTYTESGWITSHEWFVNEPTNAELRALHTGGHRWAFASLERDS